MKHIIKMKKYLFILIGLLLSVLAQPQVKRPDIEQMSQLYRSEKTDSNRVKLALSLSDNYSTINIDSAIKYANVAVKLSTDLNNDTLILFSKFALAEAFSERDIPVSMRIYFEILEKVSKLNRRQALAGCFVRIGQLYLYTGSDEKYIYYLRKAREIYKELGDLSGVNACNSEIGGVYGSTGKNDSARNYLNLVATDSLMLKNAFNQYYWGNTESINNPEKARAHFLKSLEISKKINDLRGFSLASRWFCIFLQNQHQIDSAIAVGKGGLHAAETLGFLRGMAYNSEQLHKIYNGLNQTDSAYKYLSINVKAKDDLLGEDKINKIQQATIAEQQRAQKLELEKEQLQSQVRLFGTGGIAFILLMFTLFIYRNQQKTRESNKLLLIKTEEINKKNNELQVSYENLQSTQSQLIQSEKMASLGELTAGIAHEIQNPLNFVNNFSEVSREMIDELKPFDKLKVSAEQEDVLNDIDANLEKINHHGKRAADIVKGMLQHSRSSTGVKEPTDINALCDEYLRLSYHGLRAKDKSFNATMKTNFDETIGNINIIPQDIGRVVLNLINNAFYAVGEKSTIISTAADQSGERLRACQVEPVETDKTNVTLRQAQGYIGYEPIVSISTKKLESKILITVSDNGNGISPKVVDKIFQPFFTTKPTGQGTGLGLSLSYDIVKAHGGEMKVETKENKGSEFIIELPINK